MTFTLRTAFWAILAEILHRFVWALYMSSCLRSKISLPTSRIMPLMITLNFTPLIEALFKPLNVSWSTFIIALIWSTGKLIMLIPVTVLRFYSKAFRPLHPFLNIIHGMLLIIRNAWFYSQYKSVKHWLFSYFKHPWGLLAQYFFSFSILQIL